MSSITNVLDCLEDTLNFSDVGLQNGSSGEFDAKSVALAMKSELSRWPNGQWYDTSKFVYESHHLVSGKYSGKGDQDTVPLSKGIVECKSGQNNEADVEMVKNSLQFESKDERQEIEEREEIKSIDENALSDPVLIDTKSTEKYACETCGLTVKTISNLKQHQATHCTEKFTCEDCEMTFKSETTLMNHQIKYKCGSQTFEYLAANFGGKVCKLCGFTTTTSRFRNHNCKMLPMLRCNLCPYSTRVTQRMEVHKASGHIEELICTFCSYQATAKSGCDPKYILKRHIDAKHNDGTTYSCDDCDFKDTNYTKVNSHIASKHRVFTCQECNKEEKNVYQLKQHTLKVHAIGKIQCALCEFSATSKYLVEKHQRVAHLLATFQCNQCSYIGESDYMLKKHTKQKHSGDPSYVCSQCSYIGESDYMLKKHTKQKHSGDPLYTCSQCGFRASSMYRLTEHMKKLH